MKPLYLLTLLMTAAVFHVPAQEKYYFNDAGEKASPQLATSYKMVTRTDSGYQVVQKRRDGRVMMTGAYLDDSLKIRNGSFAWYDSSGITRRCNFVNNKANGPDTFYYPIGQVRMAGNEVDDRNEEDWIAWYPSGKWKSAIIGGIPVDTYKKQPIVFKLVTV